MKDNKYLSKTDVKRKENKERQLHQLREKSSPTNLSSILASNAVGAIDENISKLAYKVRIMSHRNCYLYNHTERTQKATDILKTILKSPR